MSEAKRAYNVLRSYVNQEWERIRGIDLHDAWQELNGPTPTTLKEPTASIPDPTTASAPNELEATARTILNVTAKADFEEIRVAFEKINRRVQPENFESGTSEATHAQELLRKATWAYQFLTKDMSPAERRFKSLEIE
jgi:hypothetical protein